MAGYFNALLILNSPSAKISKQRLLLKARSNHSAVVTICSNLDFVMYVGEFCTVNLMIIKHFSYNCVFSKAFAAKHNLESVSFGIVAVVVFTWHVPADQCNQVMFKSNIS